MQCILIETVNDELKRVNVNIKCVYVNKHFLNTGNRKKINSKQSIHFSKQQAPRNIPLRLPL